MKKIFFSGFLFLAIVFSGCSKENGIKVVNWNCQTFFDAKYDGNEYKEFRSSAQGWTKDEYVSRLERLCSTLEALDGDVVVLEELENAGILYDISNRLQRNSFKPKSLYRFCCFAREPDSSIGIGVLSRLKIQNVKLHSMFIAESGQPSMRPIMEMEIVKDKKKSFTVFANHWKSKSGGQKETEIWRDYQEGILSECIDENLREKPEQGILCAGDFNRDMEDFHFTEEKDSVFLRNPVSKKGRKVEYLWKDFQGNFGSYYFRGEWERIDHFFAAGNISAEGFDCNNEGPWADENSRPFPYRMYSKTGYSDHLPITCFVKL